MTLRHRTAGWLWVCAGLALAAGCTGDAGPRGPAGPAGPPGEDPMADPSISAVAPGRVFLDRRVDVALGGSGTAWTTEAQVDFGAGITVEAVTVASPTAIVATIAIDGDAPLGARDVVVADKGSETRFEKAFHVEAPLELVALEGAPAQGSILAGVAGQRDVSTPFDTLLPMPVRVGESSAGVPEEATPYFVEFVTFVDVGAAAGPQALVVESGPPEDVTASRLPGAVDVAERAPVALPEDAPASGALSAPFASLLYRFDAPANQLVTLEIAASDPAAQPAFVLLPASGRFDDALAYTDAAAFASGAAGGGYFLVVWDQSGASGYDFALQATTLPLHDVEPNGDASTASPAEAGATLLGVVDPPGDHDWFAIGAAAGATITATVGPGAASACEPFGGLDSEIEIYDADGSTSLAANDDIDGDNWCSSAQATVAAAGTYYVRVAGSSLFCGQCTFDYSLVIDVQ